MLVNHIEKVEFLYGNSIIEETDFLNEEKKLKVKCKCI